ncbi:MAG TPA: chitobiase/beta-hexosaminidase C-terminal domain-containing protein [Nocardioides sp.]
MHTPDLAPRQPKRKPTRRPSRRTTWGAMVGAAGLAATSLATLPASGTVVDAVEGHNVTVFHNIDFVAVFGHGAGDPVTVEVIRNGVTIGTATGSAAGPEGEIGLEVNHGPEGVPAAGDCWEGRTPDIRPGDTIRVTSPGGVDEVVVDNLAFTGNPRRIGSGDIVVPFRAKRADGTAILPSSIDSAEFRAGSRLRYEATEIIVERQPGGAPGALRMRYTEPFQPGRNRDALSSAAVARLLLGDGHATGFGHTEVLPTEAMLLDGLGDTPGPAPGCEDIGPAATWTISGVTPETIGLANLARGLTVRGASHEATSVTVTLNDNDATTTGGPVTATVTPSGTPAQTWTASFTADQLAGLNGRISVVAQHELAGGTISGGSATVLKDLVAPAAPRASVPAGTYSRTQRVRLRTAAANTIRYTLGNGSQPRPTATRGTVYRGEAIRISSTQVLKMVAVDRARNVSQLVTNRYRIR